MKKILSLFIILATGMLTLAFIGKNTVQPKPWIVPEKCNKMVNPVKADAESIKEGKALYIKHCQSCHGKTGLGDGTKASTLDTDAGDFSKPKFQQQSDGILYYKTAEGRDDMPSFKKKIPDEDDHWNIVNYLRTFKK